MKKLKTFVFLLGAVSLLFFLQACATATQADSHPPKYVFLMIGDGMGQNPVKLARIHAKLNMDAMPVKGELQTNNVFDKTTDSAAAATALACGVKTYNGALGLDKDKKPVESSAALAKKAGYKVGLLTTVTFNHATPAGFYAHVEKRSEYAKIASQAYASNYDLIMGYGVSGLKEAVAAEDAEKAGLQVFNKNQDAFFALNAILKPTLVFKHFGYEMNRPKTDDTSRALNEYATEAVELLAVEKPTVITRNPSYGTPVRDAVRPLNEYTAKAIELLYKDNPKGFFLMVEGGKIDLGGHSNDTYAMMTELLEFDQAVARALEFYKKHPEDTLIVVTADHNTGGLTLPEKLSADLPAEIAENNTNFNGRKFSFKKDETIQSIEEKLAKLGIRNLTAAEKESFVKILKSNSKNKIDALNRNALRIADARIGITWTTKGHTPHNVYIFAIGKGAEQFSGVQPNSNVGRIMKSFYEKK